MPELPEVETVRLGLAPALLGHSLTRVNVKRADLRKAFPENFATRLTGRRVVAVTRRAKYLLIGLDNNTTLVMHLGMSGRITIHHGEARAKPGRFHNKAPDDGSGSGKHDHVVFETDADARIVFNDHRRFGLMTLVDTDTLEQDKLFRDVGIEPLSAKFNTAALAKMLDGKKTPIKSALLDQRLIAGLGNIYVCEALFRSRISPKRLAGAIGKDRLAPLAAAIKKVLKDAIAAGGSTLRDHAQATGDPGNFQHQFLVYGREGKPCKLGCPGTVKRIVQSGRSTFYCPKCQT
jgi:formamidopyrimidine-DNA glycosylase